VTSPRIPPGTARDIGRVNFAIARALGLATGGGPPNIFTTLARHRGLFRKWLRFAGALMPGGTLPREDSELLILRVAHNTGCEYEWRHHERIGQSAGLTAEEVQRVREGPDADGWTPRRRLLLRAADELHADRTISDALWAQLCESLSDVDLIELCMLVGHYEMLAMTLNALRVEPDAQPIGAPPRVLGVAQRILRRRQEAGA
jgi:AhpD family alkylhydroperoxidase